jgi:hypothetical protein
MLGLAVSNASGEVRNRIYRYEWHGGGSSKFVEGKMILDLPGTPISCQITCQASPQWNTR